MEIALPEGVELERLPGPDAVDVWRMNLSVSEAARRQLARCLSPEEAAQAGRLAEGPLRRRFVARRGVLRAILSAQTGLSTSDVRYRYSPLGKPSVEGRAAVRFSVSHSEDTALFAVSLESEIGVDVEKVRPDFPWQPVAADHFAPRELALLDAAPAAERAPLFFALWTAKEAVAKALGVGVGETLQDLDVAEAYRTPGRPVATLRDDLVLYRLPCLRSTPLAGYAAALAVLAPDRAENG